MLEDITMKKTVLACILIILMIASIASSSDDAFLIEVQKSYTEKEALKLIETAKGKKKKQKLYLGIIYHNLSAEKPEKYLDKAVEYLDQSYQESKNPLALGYYGSATTMEAGVAIKKGNFVTAAAKVEKGFELIDKSVKLDEKSVFLRFLRTENAIEVSNASPFKRYDVAKKDLEFLEKHYPSFDKESQARYHLLSGQLSLAEMEIEPAVVQFEKVLQIAPKDSIYAKKAKQFLLELEE
jgi:tetratricopeptide (TPR) repeat protein